jgi:hypothetical protein
MNEGNVDFKFANCDVRVVSSYRAFNRKSAIANRKLEI